MMFFRRNSARAGAEPARASAPDGLRIYAIGDIHGRRDLLAALTEKIAADLRAQPAAAATAVFLGDYIDRGPDSFGVTELLASGSFPIPFVALRGNHEATLLRFLDDEEALGDWRHYGGLETLVSYGLNVQEAMRGQNFGGAQSALCKAMPAHHLSFFRDMKLSWSAGDYFFCHAGVRPNVPLARQSEHDLLWIRHEFNDYRGPHEKIIVHGHTPVAAPEVLPNRINVDTGAYATDILTCLILEGETRRFLST